MQDHFIEALESRIALAGIIEVFRRGSLLVFQALAAADGDSGLVLTHSGESGVLADGDGTTTLKFQGQLLAQGGAAFGAGFL